MHLDNSRLISDGKYPMVGTATYRRIGGEGIIVALTLTTQGLLVCSVFRVTQYMLVVLDSIDNGIVRQAEVAQANVSYNIRRFWKGAQKEGCLTLMGTDWEEFDYGLRDPANGHALIILLWNSSFYLKCRVVFAMIHQPSIVCIFNCAVGLEPGLWAKNGERLTRLTLLAMVTQANAGTCDQMRWVWNRDGKHVP